MASPQAIKDFQKTVWGYYAEHKRPMPWRDNHEPYWVLVSEVMLQQTQVSRVLTKFPEFVAQFPDVAALAAASTAELIAAWQGLGYNRRALNLQKAARQILEEHGGELPRTVEELVKLPGIGVATAGSLAAFVYDAPVVFIETNIRRVFIYHFFDWPEMRIAASNAPVRSHRSEPTPPLRASRFPGSASSQTNQVLESAPVLQAAAASDLAGVHPEEYQGKDGTDAPRGASKNEPRRVSDAELLPLVEATLDRANPREWYYALMDYGTHLAKTVPNPNRRSRHYSVQSKFEGSNRQLRGQVLRILISSPTSFAGIQAELQVETGRLQPILDQLVAEGFMNLQAGRYRLAE